MVLAFVVLMLRRGDRAVARNMLFALLLALAAESIASLAPGSEWPRSTSAIRDIAAIVIGGVLIRLGGIVFFRILLPVLHTNPPRILEDITITGAYIAWGLLWLRLAGVDLASIVTTSAVITGIIAFSMQETLGNILGGLALQVDNSIRIGDWVKIDDTSGRVVEVRWRYTAVETRNRETVIIPNSWLMKNRFTVIGSRSDPGLRWRRWVWFYITLDSNPTRVCQVLERAIRNAEIANVARDPAPSAVLMDFPLGSAHYALRYWLTDARPDDPTDSLVRAHCHAALMRHGIRLAIHREESFQIAEDGASRIGKDTAEEAQRLAALKSVDIFRSLSQDELISLAAHLVPAPFVAGATLTHEGDVAHWLYLVIDGEADVWAAAPNGERTRIATITPGNVFGEMSLMTGEPRRATVTARTDIECYRLDKAGFEKILRARPDIATEMSRVLETRAAQLDQLQAMRSGATQSAPKGDMLGRIRNFFGLE